jgi:hypothetical protein
MDYTDTQPKRCIPSQPFCCNARYYRDTLLSTSTPLSVTAYRYLSQGDVLTMQFGRSLLTSALLLATAMPCLAFTHSRRGPTSPRVSSKHSKSAKPAGQRTIDDARATQIQTSLIKSGYLSGEASGHWDSQTQTAMQKFQADNGWQTKLIPDSRAIIKLGLGPEQSSKTSTGTSAMTVSDVSPASGFMQR